MPLWTGVLFGMNVHEPEVSDLHPKDVSQCSCLTLILHFYPERPPNFNFTDVVYTPCFHWPNCTGGTHSASRFYSCHCGVTALAPAPLLLALFR